MNSKTKQELRIFIFFIAVVFTSLGFLGCVQDIDKKDSSKEKMITSLEKNQKNDNLYIYEKIEREIKKGSDFKKVDDLVEYTLPAWISKEQVDYANNFYQFGDLYFVLVYRSSGMFYFPSKENNFSGVLVKDKNSDEFVIWYEIKTKQMERKNIDKNNPLSIWNEGNRIYLTVAGGPGAGSGEGVMKLIYSDDFGKSWEQESCFYYGADYACKGWDREALEDKECRENEYELNERF